MNFIAFVKFSDSSQLMWDVCIPHSVSENVLHQQIRRFLASVDMSAAIFKPYHSDPFDNCDDHTSNDQQGKVVNCEDGSLFVAKQSEHNTSEWHGIILDPYSQDDGEITESIITAFEQVAKSLVLSSACSSSKLHCLCSGIQSMYAADNWWRAQSLFSYLRDGLIDLGRISGPSDEERMNTTIFVPNVGRHSGLEVLKRALRDSLPCKGLSICIFSPTNEIVLYDNMTNAEANLLCWYYVWVFNIGNRTRRRYYAEKVSETTVRLWFQTNKWRTVAQIEMNETSLPTSPWPALGAAKDLMETLASGYQ